MTRCARRGAPRWREGLHRGARPADGNGILGGGASGFGVCVLGANMVAGHVRGVDARVLCVCGVCVCEARLGPTPKPRLHGATSDFFCLHWLHVAHTGPSNRYICPAIELSQLPHPPDPICIRTSLISSDLPLPRSKHLQFAARAAGSRAPAARPGELRAVNEPRHLQTESAADVTRHWQQGQQGQQPRSGQQASTTTY
eukprot:COSAG06_NODE_5071_length_3747_cov_1.250000_1_plen_198_part_10